MSNRFMHTLPGASYQYNGGLIVYMSNRFMHTLPGASYQYAILIKAQDVRLQ